MKRQEAALRIDIVETLNSLSEQLQSFSTQLESEHNRRLPSYLVNMTGQSIERSHASRFFSQIEYLDEQEANATVRLYGFMGVRPELITQVEEINTLKQQLAALFIEAKSYHVPARRTSDKPPVTLVAATLETMGRARLQKQQATRLIQVAPLHTQSLAFFWANVRRVKKMRIEEVRKRFSRYADDLFYQSEFAQLDKLADDEHLAEVSNLPKQVRVNIGYRQQDKAQRCQRSCSLPILVPMTSPETPLLLNPLEFDIEPRFVLPRSDAKLESTPYLTLNQTKYYRYLETVAA